MNAITRPEDGAPVRKPQLRFPLMALNEVKFSLQTDYLIKGYLPRSGLIVVYGSPKSGKTFAVMDMVCHVALGEPYRGFKTKKGVVLYICCEGANGFKNRLIALQQKVPSGEPIRNFYVLTTTLSLPGESHSLLLDIKKQNVSPDLIVIDTLNRTLEGSESSDVDMPNYVKALDFISQELHCAVMVVHHTGHAEQGRPRGHSSLMGACDVQICIKRDRKTEVITATVELSKDGEEGLQTESRLKEVTIGCDEDGEPITTCIVVPVDVLNEPISDILLNIPVQKALECLKVLIEECGTPPPLGAPPGLYKVVLNEQWNQKTKEAGISKRTEAAHGAAFRRAKEKLRNSGTIAEHGAYVGILSATKADSDSVTEQQNAP